MSVFLREDGFNLRDIVIRPVAQSEERRYQELMQAHHYLGALPKIGETLWYVATVKEEWAALLSFSSAALKCGVRDRWIGWSYRHQYDRLHLVTNNSRFLILPEWRYRNLATRTLALCKSRLVADWTERFGHPLLLVETFVDPERFAGTIYKAANWTLLGYTKGYRRTRQGYSNKAEGRKLVFVQPLRADTRELLSQPVLDKSHSNGAIKMLLKANQMEALPEFFAKISDPRRSQGRRHRIATVVALAAGATLCGMRGYKAMHDWAESLGQKARQRFCCRFEKGRYIVPSEFVIRDVLVRVCPEELELAFNRWNEAYGSEDETLTLDGKTMRNAIDEEGRQTHILSVIGQQSKNCYAQKK